MAPQKGQGTSIDGNKLQEGKTLESNSSIEYNAVKVDDLEIL